MKKNSILDSFLIFLGSFEKLASASILAAMIISIGLGLNLGLPSTSTATNNGPLLKNKKLQPEEVQSTGTKAKLGKSFKFTGSSLRGKYQSSMSMKAAVENDKLMDDLLTGRTNFNDRIEQDQLRN